MKNKKNWNKIIEEYDCKYNPKTDWTLGYASVEELLGDLLSAIQMTSVYGKDHNLTKRAIDKLYSALEAVLSGRNEITVGIIGNELVFDGKPFYKTSKNMEKFIKKKHML